MILNDKELYFVSGASGFSWEPLIEKKVKILLNNNVVLDPLVDNNDQFKEVEDEEFHLLPPRGFMLALTREKIIMPDDVVGLCVGKSSYARLGLIINTTILQPGWSGQVVLELHNTTDSFIKIYLDRPVCQFLFFEGNTPSETYFGKYNNQDEIKT